MKCISTIDEWNTKCHEADRHVRMSPQGAQTTLLTAERKKMRKQEIWREIIRIHNDEHSESRFEVIEVSRNEIESNVATECGFGGQRLNDKSDCVCFPFRSSWERIWVYFHAMTMTTSFPSTWLSYISNEIVKIVSTICWYQILKIQWLFSTRNHTHPFKVGIAFVSLFALPDISFIRLRLGMISMTFITIFLPFSKVYDHFHAPPWHSIDTILIETAVRVVWLRQLINARIFHLENMHRLWWNGSHIRSLSFSRISRRTLGEEFHSWVAIRNQ